jgi:hypothetical protein
MSFISGIVVAIQLVFPAMKARFHGRHVAHDRELDAVEAARFFR